MAVKIENSEAVDRRRASTGIVGLDEILGGGLPRGHIYLLQGEAGTGKTTMGTQFLLEGVRAGETALLVTLAEALPDLQEIAHSHGWSLEGLHIFELTAAEAAQQLGGEQTIFPTAEVELSGATDEIVDVLRQLQPQRVVFDSVTEIRLLAGDPLRYRRQILSLRTVLDEIGATAIFTDIQPNQLGSRVLDSLVHGIIRLERRAPDYGATRRRMEVSKLRGVRYQEGWHDFRIYTGGVEIYPRTRKVEGDEHHAWDHLSSGIEEMDSLLGGGLEMGTACLIAGASGTGKSTLAGLFVYAALQQDIPAAILVLDERPETLYKRARDLGMPLRPYVERGLLTVRQVETGEITPGEFGHYVRTLATEKGARVIVVDSLTGYLRAMPEENLVMNQMHDLLNFLSRRGVLTLLIVTHHGLVADISEQALDVSYLSDTVVLLRHFEAEGALRQAVSVVKKRHGPHEKTIRQIRIDPNGVRVGEPMIAFRGVLTGNPEFVGRSQSLLVSGHDETWDG
jgi:circadian clock protein KaiC